jgi:hypothetical protein
MLDDEWIQAWDEFEDNVLDLLPTLVLTFPFLFPGLLGWLYSLLCWLWLRGELFLQSLRRNIDIFDIKIGGMLKGVDLSNSSLDLIAELMRPDALQDAVVVIGEYDVALRVELEDEVVGECFRTKGNYNHSLYSHLPDILHSF